MTEGNGVKNNPKINNNFWLRTCSWCRIWSIFITLCDRSQCFHYNWAKNIQFFSGLCAGFLSPILLAC